LRPPPRTPVDKALIDQRSLLAAQHPHHQLGIKRRWGAPKHMHTQVGERPIATRITSETHHSSSSSSSASSRLIITPLRSCVFSS
jgi:hypothetical protein